MTATVRMKNVEQLLDSVARFSKVPVAVGDTRLCCGHIPGVICELTREDERGWSIVIRTPAQS